MQLGVVIETMASATDRKNQQIWDAVEVNNLKQALQLCTKRIKKGEKGDYLQVSNTAPSILGYA